MLAIIHLPIIGFILCLVFLFIGYAVWAIIDALYHLALSVIDKIKLPRFKKTRLARWYFSLLKHYPTGKELLGPIAQRSTHRRTHGKKENYNA